MNTCTHEWELAPDEMQPDSRGRMCDMLKVWYCPACGEVRLCAAYPSRAPRPELETT